jgi:PilZ domain
MTQSSEPRRHPRYAVDVDATLTLSDGRRLKMRTRDLSRNGVCLIAGESVAPGAAMSVDLVLSFGNNAFSEPLVLSARVVWCTQIADAFQLGAMFDEVTDEQDGFLDMFLHFLDGTITPSGVRIVEEEAPAAAVDPDDKDNPFRR